MTIAPSIKRSTIVTSANAAKQKSRARLDLSIIIVNWNAGEHLAACLDSLKRHLPDRGIEIIVVDNDSNDGMADRIDAEHPGICVVRMEANLGFAAANNRALAQARGRYLLLLNPDTEIGAGTIPAARAYADAHPNVGVVGVRAFRSDDSQQSTMFRLPRLRDLAINVVVPNRLMRRSRTLGSARYANLDLNETHDVEVIAGCFMLVRREVYAQLGGLDESFFMYGEEAEWCHRIGRAGWRIVYCPDGSILHQGGVCADQSPDDMNKAMARSQVRLFRRVRGRLVARVAALLMLARDLPRAVAWHLCRLIPFMKDSTRLALRRSAERCGAIAKEAFGASSRS